MSVKLSSQGSGGRCASIYLVGSMELLFANLTLDPPGSMIQ